MNSGLETQELRRRVPELQAGAGRSLSPSLNVTVNAHAHAHVLEYTATDHHGQLPDPGPKVTIQVIRMTVLGIRSFAEEKQASWYVPLFHPRLTPLNKCLAGRCSGTRTASWNIKSWFGAFSLLLLVIQKILSTDLYPTRTDHFVIMPGRNTPSRPMSCIWCESIQYTVQRQPQRVDHEVTR